MHGEPPAPLEPEQSAALREKLLTELGTITSADLAAVWAQEALAAKNSLAAADAKLVEDAFERRLSELAPSQSAEAADDGATGIHVDLARAHATPAKGNGDPDQPDGINKSVLVLATPRRYRNREHLRYVAQQACLLCGRKPSDPHHLGFTQPRALGRKVSDEFAVPVCRGHHRAVHRSRDERAWWRQAGIDPIKVARRLWKETRGLGQRRSNLGRMPLPHPLIQPQRRKKPAPRQRRKKELAYRIFPASKHRSAGCLRMRCGDLTNRWRRMPRTSTRPANAADHAAAHGVTGSLIRLSLKTFEDIRSYRAFERTLIGSIDPRSAIELTLVHRLASLLWRLRRASAIETGLFEIEDELLLACRKDPSRGPDQVGTIATATRPNGHGKIPRLNHGAPDHPANGHDRRRFGGFRETAPGAHC
jgi:hypothetical protein